MPIIIIIIITIIIIIIIITTIPLANLQIKLPRFGVIWIRINDPQRSFRSWCINLENLWVDATVPLMCDLKDWSIDPDSNWLKWIDSAPKAAGWSVQCSMYGSMLRL